MGHNHSHHGTSMRGPHCIQPSRKDKFRAVAYGTFMTDENFFYLLVDSLPILQHSCREDMCPILVEGFHIRSLPIESELC